MHRQGPLDPGAIVLGHRHARVRHVDTLDDEHLAVELDLTSCVSHQTGGIDPSGRERPGERSGKSTGRSSHDVVQCAGVDVELAFRHPVVLCDLTVHPVQRRLNLARKEGGPDRPLPPLDSGL